MSRARRIKKNVKGHYDVLDYTNIFQYYLYIKDV